jgi:hypothetical protein
MKKRKFKSLVLSKKTISTFNHLDALKGGNTSNTSCLCGPSECECILGNTMRV